MVLSMSQQTDGMAALILSPLKSYFRTIKKKIFQGLENFMDL